MYIDKFLRNLFNEKKIMIKDVAEKMGVSASNLSNVIKGKHNISDKGMLKLISVLDLTEEEEKEAWRSWSLERMDEKTAKYFLDLENENKKMNDLLNAIKFLKKE